MNPTPTPDTATTNQPPEKCPKCGAAEIASNVPRTTYACGASDYDQRPGTFKPCGEAPNSPAPVNIARLRELLAKATPGPWITGSIPWKVWANGGRNTVCDVAACGDAVPIEGTGLSTSESMAANCDLIAALRNDAPALLDEVERRRTREASQSTHIIVPKDRFRFLLRELRSLREEVQLMSKRIAGACGELLDYDNDAPSVSPGNNAEEKE